MVNHEFVEIVPKSEKEITEGAAERFIIKVGASFCPPCRSLAQFLKSGEYNPPANITIYVLQTDGPDSEFAKEISRKIGCKNIPYCYVTDKSLKKIDVMIGYEKSAFVEFIEKNFNK